MAGERKRIKRRRKSRRAGRRVTLAEVDQFLDSPVARRYYAFGESNVKRRLIRMLFFLRGEVQRLSAESPEGGPARPERTWAGRVGRKG